MVRERAPGARGLAPPSQSARAQSLSVCEKDRSLKAPAYIAVTGDLGAAQVEGETSSRRCSTCTLQSHPDPTEM